MSKKNVSINNSNQFTIGIDASNIRGGGGLTHLIELLRIANPLKHDFDQIIVWGEKATLSMLDDHSWLRKQEISDFYNGFMQRTIFQCFYLTKAAQNAYCGVIFVPGGSYVGSFNRVVTMSQNLLPFQMTELRRYGLTLFTLKLLLLRLVQSYSFRKSDGVIFLTKYAKQAVLIATGKLHGKFCIIPHGINPRFLREPKPQFPIDDYDDDNPYRVLYVSIIDQYKHQWNLIDAIGSLRKMGLPIVLDLVGPSYIPALNRMKASMTSFDDNQLWVNYHGIVPFNELHHIYDRANLGVFASSCENMPMILMETMASGLPIACSNMGPMPEILGEKGVYFHPERSEEIFRALHYLIKSPQLRKEIAQDSYERSQQYTWQRCADETFGFLTGFKK